MFETPTHLAHVLLVQAINNESQRLAPLATQIAVITRVPNPGWAGRVGYIRREGREVPGDDVVVVT